MYLLFYSVFCMCCPLCPSLCRRLTGNKSFLTIASSRWDKCVGIRIHRCWNQESGPCRALCNRCQILRSVCPCQSNSTLLHGIEAAFRSLRWNDKEAGADTWNCMSEAAKVSLEQNCVPLPPWRTLAFMSCKWLTRVRTAGSHGLLSNGPSRTLAAGIGTTRIRHTRNQAVWCTINFSRRISHSSKWWESRRSTPLDGKDLTEQRMWCEEASCNLQIHQMA